MLIYFQEPNSLYMKALYDKNQLKCLFLFYCEAWL